MPAQGGRTGAMVSMDVSSFFLQFGVILLLILANGIFSMAEMAVVSARKIRLQQRAEDGSEAARAALDLAQHPNEFLSTVQIGITLIGTLTGAVGGANLADDVAAALRQVPALAPYADGLALGLIVLTVTYFSLVLGELVPKRLALSNPETIASGVALPMKLVAQLGRPLVWILGVSTSFVLRLLRVQKPNDPPVTPEEITVMMEQGEQVGVFEQTETDIVESVFRLGDLRAGSLMTPRRDIDWIDLDDEFDDILRQVYDSPHGHFPVARGSLDNVLGILRSKDMLTRLVEHDNEVDIGEIAMPAQFVHESMPAFQVLDVLKSASGNLALVIDEYGGVLGMLTLFDAMEAMIGGISERGEPVVPRAVRRDDGSWLVEGMMRIDEMKKMLDMDELPEENRAGYETVGGFVMAQLGNVPTAGQSFNVMGWRFEVMDMDGMRVDKVLIAEE